MDRRFFCFRLAGSVLVAAGPQIGTISAVCAADEFDHTGLGDYNPALRKAVQKALKERGYYHGTVDGVVGPATKSAMIRFRKDKGIYIPSSFKPDPNYRLTDDLVQELFGIAGGGVHSWLDQDRLLTNLNLVPERETQPSQ